MVFKAIVLPSDDLFWRTLAIVVSGKRHLSKPGALPSPQTPQYSNHVGNMILDAINHCLTAAPNIVSLEHPVHHLLFSLGGQPGLDISSPPERMTPLRTLRWMQFATWAEERALYETINRFSEYLTTLELEHWGHPKKKQIPLVGPLPVLRRLWIL